MTANLKCVFSDDSGIILEINKKMWKSLKHVKINGSKKSQEKVENT